MLKYNPDNYKDLLSMIDTSKSFFLENVHDQPYYAFLNWRMNSSKSGNNFKETGEGFFVSAIVQMEKCLEENSDRKADGMIFSIFFNIIHALELYIKAMIKICDDYGFLLQIRTHSHNIVSLINDFETKIQTRQGCYNKACENFTEVKRFVDLIFTYTQDPTFSRYPFDVNDNMQFYVKSNKNIVVDLRRLLDWTKYIFFVMDRNFINLSGELDALQYNGML